MPTSLRVWSFLDVRSASHLTLCSRGYGYAGCTSWLWGAGCQVSLTPHILETSVETFPLVLSNSIQQSCPVRCQVSLHLTICYVWWLNELIVAITFHHAPRSSSDPIETIVETFPLVLCNRIQQSCPVVAPHRTRHYACHLWFPSVVVEGRFRYVVGVVVMLGVHPSICGCGGEVQA